MKSPTTLPSNDFWTIRTKGGGGIFDSLRDEIWGLDRGDNLFCVCVCPCIHKLVCVSLFWFEIIQTF